jgi:hypothetical protein
MLPIAFEMTYVVVRPMAQGTKAIAYGRRTASMGIVFR